MPTYQNNTYCSPFFIKRWLHQKRFKEALKILNLQDSDTLLDYGCGDAYLLLLSSEIIRQENVCGYEPADNMYKEAINTLDGKDITLIQNIDDLGDKKFTKIVCLETCEHLLEADLKKLLADISKLLATDGEAIISVPIEIGPSAMAKNIFRFIKDRHYDNLSFKNYIKTAVGLPTSRKRNQKLENVNYIYSHIGFDHRKFETLLSDYLKIKSKKYSPVPFLGPVMNNTIFYKCAAN